MNEQQRNSLLAEAVRKALENSDGAEPVQIVVREGKANDVKEPKPLNIVGNIDTPTRFIGNRKENFKHDTAHIEVERENYYMTLFIDEESPYRGAVTGRLEVTDDFKKLGINDGEYVSNFDMADRIKKNRTLFESREAAMKLVSELRNFKAKVEREMELSDDKRGNVNIRKNQAVDSNIPEALKVHLQIFKGQPAETFEVEVEVNPNDLSMTLVSPEANDIIRDQRDIIINRQLDTIGKMAPGILIIEK